MGFYSESNFLFVAYKIIETFVYLIIYYNLKPLLDGNWKSGKSHESVEEFGFFRLAK